MEGLLLLGGAVGIYYGYTHGWFSGLTAGSTTPGVVGNTPANTTTVPTGTVQPATTGTPTQPVVVVAPPVQVTPTPIVITQPVTGTRSITVPTVAAARGSRVNLRIMLDSPGDVVAFGFTLRFDPSRLSNPTWSLPNAAEGALPSGTALTVNDLHFNLGQLGVLVDSAGAWPAGSVHVMDVAFDVSPNAPAGTTPVTLDSSEAGESESDIRGNLLPTNWINGGVVIS